MFWVDTQLVGKKKSKQMILILLWFIKIVFILWFICDLKNWNNYYFFLNFPCYKPLFINQNTGSYGIMSNLWTITLERIYDICIRIVMMNISSFFVIWNVRVQELIQEFDNFNWILYRKDSFITCQVKPKLKWGPIAGDKCS